ncbi:MAG: peptidylprolyl isomerase [Pseudoxanthomonas sp.]
MNRLLREPLLHFVLLGAALFLVYGWTGGPEGGEGGRIVITQGKVAQLAAGFERMRQRAPDRVELDELIADAIREEVYYREAKALRLDEDDPLVRRRLRQKLEFLSEDTSPTPEPTDAQLQHYLLANAERFRAEPRLTFRHVYFDPHRKGADDASAVLLSDLRSGKALETDRMGDPFLLGRRFDGATRSELASVFGEEFAARLQRLPLGAWEGPVTSGLGVHLVQVQKRERGEVPALADIRTTARKEWMHDWRQRDNTRLYAELRERYKVTVEHPGGVEAPDRALAVARE